MENGHCNNLENVIDRILFSARDLKKKLELIKHYTPDDEELGPVPDQLKNAQKIRELEKENIELRQALEDHQYGLEFIMSKYRSQVVGLIELNKMEKNITPPNTLCPRRNDSLE